MNCLGCEEGLEGCANGMQGGFGYCGWGWGCRWFYWGCKSLVLLFLSENCDSYWSSFIRIIMLIFSFNITYLLVLRIMALWSKKLDLILVMIQMCLNKILVWKILRFRDDFNLLKMSRKGSNHIMV